MQPPAPVSRPHTGRDGVIGWSQPVPPDDVAPCVMCGWPCNGVIDALRIHKLCWEDSTSEERPAPPAPPDTQPGGGQLRATAEPTAHASDSPAAQPIPPAPAAATSAPGAPRSASPRPTPSQPTPPRRAAPQARTAFRAAAAVVDTDGVWCSNGEHFPLPAPPAHLGDLLTWAQKLHLGTAVTAHHVANGQIWVGDALARHLGIDVDTIRAAAARDRENVAREVTRSSAGVTAALEAGWSLGGRDRDRLGRWTRLWRGQDRSIWIVLLAALTDGDDVPLLRGDPDHATLARRIGLLSDALGHPYQLSGSTTGLDLMMGLRGSERDRFFGAHEPVPPALLNIEADLNWSRPPMPEESEHQWVHAYDRSGSYLAGVAGLELGVGEAVYHPEGTAFTPRLPGYWRIEVPEPGDWRMPNPLDPRGVSAGRIRWVTTPSLEFAVELGYQPPILEAYTWPTHTRVLDTWYERIRDARTRLDVDDVDAQVARDQLKAIYAPTIGLMGSQQYMAADSQRAARPGYAPERRHHIVAKARTNILRRIVKIGEETGRWPVAIAADTVLYTSPDPDPVASWPGGAAWLGRALGRYKPEGSALLADQLPYLTGGLYRGKDALMGRDTTAGE